MPSLPPRSAPLSWLPLTLVAVLAACSEGGLGTVVKVAAGDESCRVEKTRLRSGPHTFKVRNDGSKVTEIYVYGRSDSGFDKVVSEVEDIGPGTSRDMSVDLGAGTYQIACKPGQHGDGIRQELRVTGTSGS